METNEKWIFHKTKGLKLMAIYWCFSPLYHRFMTFTDQNALHWHWEFHFVYVYLNLVLSNAFCVFIFQISIHSKPCTHKNIKWNKNEVCLLFFLCWITISNPFYFYLLYDDTDCARFSYWMDCLFSSTSRQMTAEHTHRNTVE